MSFLVEASKCKELTSVVPATFMKELILNELSTQKDKEKTLQVLLKAFSTIEEDIKKLADENAELEKRLAELESADKASDLASQASQKADQEAIQAQIKHTNALTLQRDNLKIVNNGYVQRANERQAEANRKARIFDLIRKYNL